MATRKSLAAAANLGEDRTGPRVTLAVLAIIAVAPRIEAATMGSRPVAASRMTPSRMPRRPPIPERTVVSYSVPLTLPRKPNAMAPWV